MPAAAEPIIHRCKELGFALAGVCDARPSERERELRDWLGRGEHGSMEYLARNTELRLNIEEFFPGARSIVMVADQYHHRSTYDETAMVQDGGDFGRIARYARGADYHKTIKKRLHALCDEWREQHPDEQFRAFVDTAPVLEREHAARAGLGWIGKHTLLIHPRLGSWLFLGGVVTTLDIAPPKEPTTITDHCGACTRCIDACPTGAIAPYSVNASRCIAYLTIERRESIDVDASSRIGDWIFGCDICQEVCPHNSPRPAAIDCGDPNAAYAPKHAGFELLDLLGWREDDRRRAFESSALKRATLAMMKRNAILSLASRGRLADPAVRRRLTSLMDDTQEPELVRTTARSALASAAISPR